MDQQHIARPQGAVAERRAQMLTVADPAGDREAVRAIGVDLFDAFADQGRAGQNPQLGEVAIETEAIGRIASALARRQQQASDQQHVHRAGQRQSQSDRRDSEQIQARSPRLPQQGAGYQERRGDRGDRGPQRASDRHRQEQLGGGHAAHLGQTERGRQHDRRDRHVVRERGQQCRRGHDHGQHPRQAATGEPSGPAAQGFREPGVSQTGAEYEDCGDDDRRLALEAGQGFLGTQDAGQCQRQDDEQSDQIGAQPLGDEQADGHAEDGEENNLVNREEPCGNEEVLHRAEPGDDGDDVLHEWVLDLVSLQLRVRGAGIGSEVVGHVGDDDPGVEEQTGLQPQRGLVV